MNKKQLIVLWIGIGLIVLMGLFPPFITDSKIKMSFGYEPAKYVRGYAFFFSDEIPERSRRYNETDVDYREDAFVPAHIDITRLLIQWVLVTVITISLVITLKDKKKD